MRRGSIQTWESLARRQSANMAQFASNRSEFTTSDVGLSEIEYERKGGFFMSHKKTAFAISAFVVIIIAAGFVGAYIGSIPKEKVYDTFALIESDVGCDHVESSKYSLSTSLSPSRYRIELSPIFDNETITRLRGRITVEFRYNGTTDLPELVLNAKHINVTSVTLISEIIEQSEDSRRRKRRYAVDDDGKTSGNSPQSQSMANESVGVVAENSTADYAFVGSLPYTANLESGNGSLLMGNTSSETDGSSNSNATEVPGTGTTTDLDFSSATNGNGTSTSSSGESSSIESPVKNETQEIAISKKEIDEKGGYLVLHTESPIKPGKYYLEIDYEVPINGYVIYATNKSENNSERWMAASRIRPTNLRKFFPVFDDSRMKARFSLSLPRPVGMKIYSNMPLKRTNTLLNEWTMDTFEETPPISPRNLAVAATRRLDTLGTKTISNTTINFWDENLRQGAATYLMDKIEPIFQSFTELFSVNLSIPKLDIIGLQHSDYNSAYPGLVLIQESLYDVKADSPEVTRQFALMNLIKLIGQQWLGGLVDSQNSSDVWILESSLLYLQHRLLKEINSEFNRTTFVMDVQPDVFEVNGYSVSRSLRSKLEPVHSNSFYTREAYAIGACLIRMLHSALRETQFRDGYASFVSRWSGDNADVTSFWEAMTANSTADEQPEGEAHLLEIMDLWTSTGGYPVITVTRNYETGSAIVHQARFSYDNLSSASSGLWHVPLTWISSLNPQISLAWMKNQAETTLQLVQSNSTDTNNGTWVVFNPTKDGYYRVNYDRENWKLIAEALRDNHEIFSPVTRASLIDDVFSLGFVRAIPYSVVFDVIEYLPENEREPEPWTYLLHHTFKLNLVLYDSPEYFEYQALMLKFASRLFDQIGLQINQGSRLTMIAHVLSCMFDYPAYHVWAKENYAGFENLPGLPIKNEVPSYLHESLLCAFAQLNHELGWQWWEKKFANVTNREERNSLLSSLACFEVPSMLQAVLNEIVYSESFDSTDALVILESFSIYPAAAQTALKFVESHWKNIARRYPKSCKIVSAFLDAASTGFTGEKDIEDFQSFRDKNYESLKKVGYAAALLEAKANASVSFITSLPENPMSKVNKTILENVEEDGEQTLGLESQ